MSCFKLSLCLQIILASPVLFFQPKALQFLFQLSQMIAVAMAAFKDSALSISLAKLGIVILFEISFSSLSDIPCDSLPITNIPVCGNLV